MIASVFILVCSYNSIGYFTNSSVGFFNSREDCEEHIKYIECKNEKVPRCFRVEVSKSSECESPFSGGVCEEEE